MNSITYPFIVMLLILTAGLVIHGIYARLLDQQRFSNRIKKIQKLAYGSGAYKDPQNLSPDIVDSLKNIEQKMATTFSGFTRETAAAQRLKFEQAGLNATYAPAITLLCNICFAGIFLVFYGLVLSLTNVTENGILFDLILLVLFLFFSLRFFGYILDFKISRRYKRIQKSLAFSVDMLAICTRSSLSLEQAFEKIAEEMGLFNQDLSEEFIRVAIELRMIPNRSQALRNFAKRLDLPMVQLLVSGLIHALEHGVSLSQTLTNLSLEFSKYRLIAVEEKAARLPVLLTIPLALFSLPATMIILIGPIFATIRTISIFN
ncbi:MAG: type II secretion system F family protein [Candidatus Paracaedibacteraceae bacterium]|nr:type II secretion system F family protein [Candidatus Paracaedibacteraceae bacterium]